MYVAYLCRTGFSPSARLDGLKPVLHDYSGGSSALGQTSFSAHSLHFGLRAMQTALPCAMRRCEKSVHSFGGISFIRSSSIFTASKLEVSPSRAERRVTTLGGGEPPPSYS